MRIYRLILWFRRLRYFVAFRVHGGLPQLVINVRYEPIARWSIRTIIWIGVLSSLISFPSKLLALLFSLVLLVLQWVLEKRITSITTAVVMPLPDYRDGDWLGVAWGFDLEGQLPYTVGLIFKDTDAAERIFPIISLWNEGKQQDPNNNIEVSVVIESGDTYSLYVYPNLNGPTVPRPASPGTHEQVHNELVVAITMCRQFQLSSSQYQQFWQRYSDGQLYWLAAYYRDANGNAVPCPDIPAILKTQLPVKDRQRLSSSDREYEHGRVVMGV